MRIGAVAAKLEVTVTMTGHEAAWLAAVCGKLCGTPENPAAKFLAELYVDLIHTLDEHGVGMPRGDDVIVVRDGKIWHAGAHTETENGGDPR